MDRFCWIVNFLIRSIFSPHICFFYLSLDLIEHELHRLMWSRKVIIQLGEKREIVCNYGLVDTDGLKMPPLRYVRFFDWPDLGLGTHDANLKLKFLKISQPNLGFLLDNAYADDEKWMSWLKGYCHGLSDEG